jgi:tol-pal system protein YbgF
VSKRLEGRNRVSGRRAAVPAVVLIALLTTGCSSFEQRVAAVESRQAAIEQQIVDLQQEQAEISGRLVQVRQELDNALQPLRTQSADRGEDLRSMQREVTALEEQLAQVNDRIGRLTETMAAGGGPSRGQEEVGMAMPPPRGARPPQTGGAAAPATDSAATALYNNAFNDYLRENYELCVQGFEEYIRRYATSARADDAQYWIGECHSSRGDTAAAREAFRTLIRDYPDSDKIPDAMLRDGLILKEGGQPEAAAEAFRRLIQGYPASDAAFLACRQLDTLGAAAPQICQEMQ